MYITSYLKLQYILQSPLRLSLIKYISRIMHMVCVFKGLCIDNSLLLTWISNHLLFKCGMKLFIHSQTSKVQLLKFWMDG